MHKRIKNIIAVSLILSAVCGVVPSSNLTLGLGVAKAYASSSDDNYDYKYAYLEGIYLSDGSIDFDKRETEYDVNVNNDVTQITVKAVPEDTDDIVEINGSSVDDGNNYKKKVDLDEGKNVITIYVESDDEDRTYTLNVYRASKSDSSTTTNGTTTTSTGPTSTTSTTSTNTTGVSTTTSDNGVLNFKISDEEKKNNAWQRVDGKWRYVDGTGQYLKSTWWFDKNSGKNYYLDKDGNRASGWIYDNNYWYYLNEAGEMQTGWTCINKNWYFLNKSGAMQMGWLEDSSGNWYYLNSAGAMQTGWVENSDGKWYYFDSTGKMITNSSVGGYQLSSDGTLVN